MSPHVSNDLGFGVMPASEDVFFRDPSSRSLALMYCPDFHASLVISNEVTTESATGTFQNEYDVCLTRIMIPIHACRTLTPELCTKNGNGSFLVTGPIESIEMQGK